MSQITEIDATQFEDAVLTSETPIIVDFYGENCSVCKTVAQWLDDFDATHMLPVRKVFLADPTSPLAQHYNLRGIPTLIRFENGKEIARLAGQFSMDAVREFVSSSS